MELSFKKSFKKQYAKLPKKVQIKFQERLLLFSNEPHHPLLHRHTLIGADYPIESVNITSDCRALFLVETDLVTFIKIGTHSELYG